jgi:hypothetical protein
MFPVPRLFKYVKAKTAITILENRALQWSTVDAFNDPFEFKRPFAYSVKWDEMTEVALHQYARILTPPTKFQLLAQQWKEDTVRDAGNWREMKKAHLVLCLSAVHNHILMWSHYADNHRGAVLGFRPTIQLGGTTRFATTTLFARPVAYSLEVPIAATLEEYVGYLTGEKAKPDASEAFEKSAYIKSSVWAYENEWRVLEKKRTGDEGPFAYREFHPQELDSVFLGCRMLPGDRKRIIDLVAGWEVPVSLFQMRDDPTRFELRLELISS